MTAVDVDALDKLREEATAGGWPAVDAMFAVERALPDLLAEVRRGRALREAVEGLAKVIADEAVDAIWHRDVLKQTAARITAVVAAVDPS